MSSPTPRSSPLPLAILLAFQAALLSISAAWHSPTIDEVGHMAAGLDHWKTGTFDLYRVNPPLVRLTATFPLVCAGVSAPQRTADPAPPNRPEFDQGGRFVEEHKAGAFRYFTYARWACVPFALLGTYVCFRWASDLYGRSAGWLASIVWAFSPHSLSNAQMITPDTAAASLGIAACYLFWRWLRSPDRLTALAVGIVLGFAQLSKSSWVILFAIWPTAWLAYRVAGKGEDRPRWLAEVFHLAIMGTVGLYVLNAGYGFERSFERLDAIRFTSRALSLPGDGNSRLNRFYGTPLGVIPVPLPGNYVEGIDVQKRDFEEGMRSYLRGEWRTGGWWYYYFYGLLVKTPVGTLAILALVVISLAFQSERTCGRRDEFIVLFPAVAVLTLVSSQTGFNHHLRYTLPALPFLHVFASRVAAYAGPCRRVWFGVVTVCAIASVASSLSVYPHSMSYFNAIVGGPEHGSEHLVDSNIDWGQDLLFLKQWYDEHPEARPFHLAYFGYVNPQVADIEYRLPPFGPVSPSDLISPWADSVGPRPGWYAISVTLLRGYHYPVHNGMGRTIYLDEHYYKYFLNYRPVATAGYSIFIYHLDRAECEALRAQLGLPSLSGD